jgi:hypothetical protein
MQRNRAKQTLPLKDRLTQEAKRLRAQALELPICMERQELLEKAQRTEAASEMIECLAVTTEK